MKKKLLLQGLYYPEVFTEIRALYYKSVKSGKIFADLPLFPEELLKNGGTLLLQRAAVDAGAVSEALLKEVEH